MKNVILVFFILLISCSNGNKNKVKENEPHIDNLSGGYELNYQRSKNLQIVNSIEAYFYVENDKQMINCEFPLVGELTIDLQRGEWDFGEIYQSRGYFNFNGEDWELRVNSDIHYNFFISITNNKLKEELIYGVWYTNLNTCVTIPMSDG